MCSHPQPQPTHPTTHPPLLTNYTNKSWYPFNCHCGAIRYRVFLPPLVPPQASEPSPSSSESDPEVMKPVPVPVISCACSICTRNGYLNAYPLRSEVRIRLRTGTGTDPKTTPEEEQYDEEEVHPGSVQL